MKKFLLKNYILITNMIMFILLFCLLSVFRPIVVQGQSMEPTLQTGDTLLCSTLKNPEIGDIVVIRPFLSVGEKYIIKRVTDIKDDKIFVEGDNKNNSYDSRNFGYIEMDQILGVVLQ